MRTIHAMMLGLSVAAAGIAQSATTITTNFQVSATLAAICTTSAAPLAFPAYTPGAGNQVSSSAVTVKCTKNTAYTVALNKGTTTGGTIAQRLMLNGTTNTLQYNLYTSNTYTNVLGDGTGGSTLSAGTGAGLATANTLTVFGQLPDNATNQAAIPGNYTDTITVSVTY
jgi:spore coat protein U-like protein